MRLFIYELITAGGLGSDVPASLRQEGAAMLGAMVEDFERVSGVEVLTLVSDRFDGSIGQRCQRTTAAEETQAFRRLAAEVDAALIIAPEFDDLLTRRTGWALTAGCRVLGSDRQAIRLTGDKWRLATWWRDNGISTSPTTCISKGAGQTTFPCVLKPRFGAGSQATIRVETANQWPIALAQASSEWPAGDFVAQPFVAGQPVSVGLLVGLKQIIATPGATQHFSHDGRFRYLGGRTPLPSPLRDRAIELARRAIACVPGLQGYVGVDLILGDSEDGGLDIAVEINPRLTTSYIGLRRLTQANLAELWLRICRGEQVVEPEWSEDVIEFTADGRVTPRSTVTARW